MSPRVVTPLKLAIVASGLTISELSNASGISKVQISRLSAGQHRPLPPTARALADALGATTTDLWPESEAA